MQKMVPRIMQAQEEGAANGCESKLQLQVVHTFGGNLHPISYRPNILPNFNKVR